MGINYRVFKKEQSNGSDLSSMCLVSRTNELSDEYSQQLTANGFECYLIKRSKADERKIPGLRLATMHRVKGLEFDKVIIAGVSKESTPYQRNMQNASDTVARNEVALLERALLYVAATRAKKEVWVRGMGREANLFQKSI